MNADEAIVVKNAGSHFLLSRLPEWKPFPAVLRGKVRLKGSTSTNPVAVGDVVRFRMEAGAPLEHNSEEGPVKQCQIRQTPPGFEEGGPSKSAENARAPLAAGATPAAAIITDVLPRRNYVIRKSTNLSRKNHVIAANVDRAVIAVSLLFPEIKLPFLDRILVTCEVYGIKPVIVLNKIDLYGDLYKEEVENFIRIYEGAGYLVIQTSCKTGEGLDELRELCSEGVSLFSGESGVGKSSLIKALDPSLDPKIGKISAAHLQGKHTTSLYEMYPLAGGGFVVDSPGLRGFGLVDLEKEEIGLYFPEMLAAAKNCRFTPCTHTHEPDCAVKAAVDAGVISAERYNSYLGMLEEDTKFRQ